jgi:hypothetical protein
MPRATGSGNPTVVSLPDFPRTVFVGFPHRTGPPEVSGERPAHFWTAVMHHRFPIVAKPLLRHSRFSSPFEGVSATPPRTGREENTEKISGFAANGKRGKRRCIVALHSVRLRPVRLTLCRKRRSPESGRGMRGSFGRPGSSHSDPVICKSELIVGRNLWHMTANAIGLRRLR